jgi:hypothetical protein
MNRGAKAKGRRRKQSTPQRDKTTDLISSTTSDSTTNKNATDPALNISEEYTREAESTQRKKDENREKKLFHLTVIGVLVQIGILAAISLQWLAYRQANAITQRQISDSENRYDDSRAPYLSIADFSLITNANGLPQFMYDVSNDSDYPAIINSYSMKFIEPGPPILPKSEPFESNKRDWISPHSKRNRTVTLIPDGPYLDINLLRHNLMSGVVRTVVTIEFQSLSGRRISMKYTFSYNLNAQLFRNDDVQVTGLLGNP